MRVHLTCPCGERWHRQGRAWARGHAFHTATGALLDGAALAAFLDGPAAALAGKVRLLNGTFAAILEPGDGAEDGAAAVDRIRSIPLFYGPVGGECVVSDSALWIARQQASRAIPDERVAEFMLMGMTTGSDTLVPGVQQLCAGEAITIAHERPASYRYFAYAPAPFPLHAPDAPARQALVDRGVAVFEDAFARFLRASSGAPLAIPLSGGLDSRLVAALLARARRADVLCFSYGGSGHFESTRSQHVARMLGLRWTFVPYTHAAWRRWYLQDDYQRYRRYASQLAAIEHEQDWPAVHTLQQQGLLPDGTVFVPGHTGDFIASGHLPPAAFAPGASADALTWIWDKHYRLWRDRLSPAVRDALRERIARALPGLDVRRPLPPSLAAQAFVRFNWQERQAKMIVNSVRVYDFHGYRWGLPLWDDAVMDFWTRVPLPELYRKRLYLDVVRALVGAPLLQIPYAPPRRPPRLARLLAMLDPGLRRYGAYFDGSPLVALATRPLRRYLTTAHPIVAQLTRPWQHLPLQRVPPNSLLALFTLQDAMALPGESEAA